MLDANRKFRRIADAPNIEQLGDCLAEILYALIFAGLEFRVEIEPLGEEGPDLRISRDWKSAIVEIMHFRQIYPGPPKLSVSDEDAILGTYGNPSRDIRKSIQKILKKISQVGNDESIIAIWNDDKDLEEIEVRHAINDLRDEATQHIQSLPRSGACQRF